MRRKADLLGIFEDKSTPPPQPVYLRFEHNGIDYKVVVVSNDGIPISSGHVLSFHKCSDGLYRVYRPTCVNSSLLGNIFHLDDMGAVSVKP